MASEAIEQIEVYSLTLYDRVAHAMVNNQPGDVVELKLTVTAPSGDELVEELKRLHRNG